MKLNLRNIFYLIERNKEQERASRDYDGNWDNPDDDSQYDDSQYDDWE